MTEATPSRDSQEERHCENARQARSGWPRWNVEDSSPAVTAAKARTMAVRPKTLSAGSIPSAPKAPIRASRP